MDGQLKIVGDAPPWDEELRSWLESYIAIHPHHTTETLSRSFYIGYSSKALNAYLDCTYYLPKKDGGLGVSPKQRDIENCIRRYREEVEGTDRQGYKNTFLETRTWFQVQNACMTAMKERVIVIVYGAPGVGKSRSLREFATRHMTTPPIFVLCSRNVVPSFFAQTLALKVGIKMKGMIARIEDSISEKLRRYPRMLIIDQANYLDERALGIICHIWEVAHVPIMLSGTKDLYDLFMNSSLTQDVRAQFSSRVASCFRVSELDLGEAKAILERALGEDVNNEVITQIYNFTGGVHRHLDMIIPRILELKREYAEQLKSGEIGIDEVIRVAGSRLMT